MPIYNVPLLSIDTKETRRYAGLQTAAFDEHQIEAACEEARLLAHPRVRAARVMTEKSDVYADCEGVGVEVFGLNPAGTP